MGLRDRQDEGGDRQCRVSDACRAAHWRECHELEREGPCPWPHQSDSVEDGDVWFTTVRFNAAEDEVESVRAMITSVLAEGSIVGPDGRRTTWGSFG
jgi:hypothetical protein